LTGAGIGQKCIFRNEANFARGPRQTELLERGEAFGGREKASGYPLFLKLDFAELFVVFEEGIGLQHSQAHSRVLDVD